MDFQDKKNLFKVRQTLLEMIQDRGYNIPENEKKQYLRFSGKVTT
jgi:hypothetical protein